MANNMPSPTNINNLNVFTFIREIYQSLKHLDIQIHTMSQQFSDRLSKLEENQQILKTRFDNVEILLQKTLEHSEMSQGLNKTIETELLKKMSLLNKQSITNVNLKPDEMTFANIIENEYTFNDINNQMLNNAHNNYTNNSFNSFNSLHESMTEPINDNDLTEFENTLENTNNKQQDINSLLF